MSENALRFENIKLVNGKSGEETGQGLRLAADYYVADKHYGFNAGSTAVGISTSEVNEDYYVVYNSFPAMVTGSASNRSNQDVSSTDLAKIGINFIRVRCKDDHSGGALDCVIVRKSDRKAVHVKLAADLSTSDYRTGWVAAVSGDADSEITLITDTRGIWTPARARLFTLGYI